MQHEDNIVHNARSDVLHVIDAAFARTPPSLPNELIFCIEQEDRDLRHFVKDLSWNKHLAIAMT
jgi:hypothetical protein